MHRPARAKGGALHSRRSDERSVNPRIATLCPSPLPALPGMVHNKAGQMILSQADIGLLKELKAAGQRGRTVRAFNTRRVLDRLASGGFVVARPTGLELVQYRITQRGQDALAEHNFD
jgi:hypothetical protein